MKLIKFAFIGTSALFAVSNGVFASEASDISALKAQIKALSAQIAAQQLSASIPPGFELVTMSMQPAITVPGDETATGLAHTISIVPTADAPASTVVQWTGLARAALVHFSGSIHASGTLGGAPVPNYNSDISSTHIFARGELSVKGKTDTAVGEVGVNVTLRGDFDGAGDADVYMTKAVGWWSLTPNLSLLAGYDEMAGGLNKYGMDKLNAFYTTAQPKSNGPDDTTQFALAYSDGPISFKAVVGHYDNSTGTAPSFAFGGQAEYKGDTFSAKAAGFVHDADYQVGLGATASTDMFTFSATGAIGHDSGAGFNFAPANYWTGNVYAGAALSEAVKVEVGAGYRDYASTPFLPGGTVKQNYLGVAGGIYYSPVPQLTIGAEAGWNKFHADLVDLATPKSAHLELTVLTADIVTVFKF